AHTHLDLTGLRGKCPPTPDFTQWLRGIIAHRRSQTPEQVAADIKTGIYESIAAGTTLVGDIAAAGASWPVLLEAPGRSIVVYEVLGGLVWQQLVDVGGRMDAWLTSHHGTATCRAGVSPHAPYSTHLLLYSAAAGWAAHRESALATHLAETRAELELLASKTG